MKTPTVDDQKPKRENLGPTGPAKVSGVSEENTLEDHPKFPEWLAAFEFLINSHNRLKATPPASPDRAEREAQLVAAKAAFRALADNLD